MGQNTSKEHRRATQVLDASCSQISNRSGLSPTASSGATVNWRQAAYTHFGKELRFRREALKAVVAALSYLVVLIASADATAQQGARAAEEASKYLQAGLLRQAEPLYKLAISEARKSRHKSRQYDQRLAVWLHQLSYVQMTLEEFEEGRVTALEARSLLAKEPQPRPYNIALNLNILGRISDFLNNHEQARNYFLAEIDLIERTMTAEKSKDAGRAGTYSLEMQLDQLDLQRKETVFNVSESFKMEGNWEESTAWCKKAAEMDLPAAQYILGLRLFEGRGIKKDLPQAAHWLQKAAIGIRPMAAAQNNLGVMYSQGLGVGQSDADAVRWYKRAAELGYPPAQINLIKKIIAGKGVESDLVAAYYWIRRFEGNGQGNNSDSDSEIVTLKSDVRARMTREQVDEVEELLQFDGKIQMDVGGELITF